MKLTREEAIEEIKRWTPILLNSGQCTEKTSEAQDMAISALSKNKCFEGMTNGEVIISLYPNLKYTIRNGRVITTIGVASSFDLDWWNAPYKAEREDKEWYS